MRILLKKYKSIYDFIIFGSAVKGKMSPRDIDIAVILESKNPALIGEIKTEIDKHIKNAHLQAVSYEDFLKSKLPYHMLSEGYSIKNKEFLFKKSGVLRKTLYTFELNDLLQNKKVMFNKGLRYMVKQTKAEKIGKGAVLAPVTASGEFDDFFSQWNRKIRKKEFFEV